MPLYSPVTTVLLVTCSWSLTSEVISNHDDSCDEYLFINSSIFLTSPGYPRAKYAPGYTRTWCISSPSATTITFLCENIDIPISAACKSNAMTVTSDKNESRSHCGSKPFYFRSLSNNVVLKFYSTINSRGGKFSCGVVSEEDNNLRAVEYEHCDCGHSYKTRIVGGTETGVNEFPFMAGLVDRRRGAIVVCGTNVISIRFTLTADHCLDTLFPTTTAVLVGDHDIAISSDTSAANLIRVKKFVRYPFYDRVKKQYDIALVELVSPIVYSGRVGPICLPFVSQDWDLTGQSVTVLGWGTTEFGGPRSRVLRKANLNVVGISDCINTYGHDVDPYTQLCTYRFGQDACQYDSGGPLVWRNSATNRYEVVGLISYGRGCAAPGIPSVSTKVAPFLQWILDHTPGETFCSNPNL